MHIPVLTERVYDFSGLGAGASAAVVLVKALDVTAYRSGSLQVRVLDPTWSGGASPCSAAVKAYTTAPSSDDPSADFVADSASATATLANGGSTASDGDLVQDALDSNFGSHLRLVLEVTQGTPAGTFQFTISAAMELNEEP